METGSLKEGEIENQVGHTSLLRNTAWLVWSGGVNIANSVLLWMAMARWREAAEVGQFASVMSVYGIFTTLCSLGLGPYLASEIARRPARKQFVASAAAMVFSWSVVCAAAMIATGYVVSVSPSARQSTMILSLAMLPAGLISVGEAVCIALARARVIALVATFENLLRAMLPLLLLYRGYDLQAIFLSFVAVRVAACAAYAIVAREQIGALRNPAWSVGREIAAVTPTFASATILAATHWQIGTVLAGRLGGETIAAEFGVASRFMVPVTMLLVSYVGVAQPVAGRLAATSLNQLGEFLARSLRLVIALGLPLTVGVWLLGRDLLALLFGLRYSGAATALGLLIMCAIPLGVVLIASRGLIAMGRQRFDLLGNLVAVVSNIALNFALIPRYGATGAAAAQLCSVTAMAAVEVWYGTRPLFALRIWQAVWLCRWPLAAMMAALLLARGRGFWWEAICGGAGYLLGAAAIRKELLPARGGASEVEDRPRVLMVGAHPTKTLGGVSTLISDILRSPLTQAFEIRHIVSQVDEYNKFGKLALALAALARFAGALLLWRPQLVYIHVGGNASLYRKIAFIALGRLAGRYALVHCHAGNFEHYFAEQGRLGRKLILWGLGKSDRFIAVSLAMQRLLRSHWPEIDCVMIPLGVNASLFAGGRAPANCSVRLLFIGKMGFLKGERDLLRALQSVVEVAPNFRLDMLGQLSDTIVAECRELGLQPLIDHLGPVSLEERLPFFKRADIFVLPTYAEGTPISMLEAMAAGLPVISTPVGGIPDVVEDGVEGYIVQPGDVKALADRIERLVKAPEQRRRMGRLAQDKARPFNWDVVLPQLESALRLAIEMGKRRECAAPMVGAGINREIEGEAKRCPPGCANSAHDH
jgi:glycosyltransferase involved in cell wall biosynthesis/O-antigen/teichoic acid export membrane protein